MPESVPVELNKTAKAAQPKERVYGAGYKLIGKNYPTNDMLAKVTGKSKYAEDFRAEGMLFCRLVLSPMPHARITRIHMDDALAIPGVKAILTADDIPAAADSLSDNGTVIKPASGANRHLPTSPSTWAIQSLLSRLSMSLPVPKRLRRSRSTSRSCPL
jgi:hypothetical protein